MENRDIKKVDINLKPEFKETKIKTREYKKPKKTQIHKQFLKSSIKKGLNKMEKGNDEIGDTASDGIAKNTKFLIKTRKGFIKFKSILQVFLKKTVALFVGILLVIVILVNVVSAGMQTATASLTSIIVDKPILKDYQSLIQKMENDFIDKIDNLGSGYDSVSTNYINSPTNFYASNFKDLVILMTVKYRQELKFNDEEKKTLDEYFNMSHSYKTREETYEETYTYKNEDGEDVTTTVTRKRLIIDVSVLGVNEIAPKIFTDIADIEWAKELLKFNFTDIYPDFAGYELSSGYANEMTDALYQKLIKEAEKYLGMPYVFGGKSPQTSFDCSGYVSWVYTKAGIKNISESAQGLYNNCVKVAEPKKGDLIFFTKTYNCPDPVSHVGIYVGDGKMLHCGNPIQYTSYETDYWKSKFYGFGRFQVQTTKGGFVDAIKQGSIDAFKQYGVLPSITIAQGILESDWGQSGLTKKANALFGIKADSSWKGRYVEMVTGEYIGGYIKIKAKFRAYNSWAESLLDHGKFLRENSRYGRMFGTTDYREQARVLQNSGYATDPQYANKLIGIIKNLGLDKIDQEALQ